MTERKLRKLILTSMPIETERLMLRYIELDDAYDMYEYASLPEVTEYLLWDPHWNLCATEGYIEFLQKRYSKGLYCDWAVVLKENNKMIGTCGFASIDNASKTCEIGYVLSPKYRKKGYMTEAVSAVIKLSFEVLQLEKINLRIIKENTESRKLAERLGFVLEPGCIMMDIKGKEREVLLYTMTK